MIFTRKGITGEVYEFTDKQQLVEMCLNVKITALAYYLTDEERFAQHSVHLINAWFIDDETKMNPNFNYGQAIPVFRTEEPWVL